MKAQLLGQYQVVGWSSSYLLPVAPGPPQADPGPPASGSGTGCLHRLASSRGNPPPAPARPLHTQTQPTKQSIQCGSIGDPRARAHARTRTLSVIDTEKETGVALRQNDKWM